MKKILVFTIAVFLFTTGICSAENYRFRLGAGSSSIHTSFEGKQYKNGSFLITGIDIIDVEKDDKKEDISYSLLGLKLALENESLAPGLRCSLGFKGVGGSIDSGATKEGEFGAIAFMGSMAYIFPGIPSPIPIEISIKLCFSPTPLSFSDSDRYIESEVGIAFYLIENASLYLSYRDYNIHMDNDDGKWKVKDDVLGFGLTLIF